MSFREAGRPRNTFLTILLRSSLLVLPLAGCASLPSNGPTARRIEHDVLSNRNTIGYRIVEITPETIKTVPPIVMRTGQLEVLGSASGQPRSDIIHPGDTLSVTVYEVGISLFGGAASLVDTTAQPVAPTANAQRIGVLVDDGGKISLPFVGTMTVAGLTPYDVQRGIETRLRGMSQHPQAQVTIADSVGNSVYLSGAITRPGRVRLTAAHERLLDIVALAGGPSLDTEDAEIHFVRDGKTAQIHLGDLRPEDADNIMLMPGDRVEILKSPRTFSVFGATDKVSQIPFGIHNVTLSDAIARAGGPSDQRANPGAVFLFRYEPAADGSGEKPVIYKLNMLNPQSYFLAQRFAMHSGDVVYFANSSTNAIAKFINLLNQLVSPAVTARILTQ